MPTKTEYFWYVEQIIDGNGADVEEYTSLKDIKDNTPEDKFNSLLNQNKDNLFEDPCVPGDVISIWIKEAEYIKGENEPISYLTLGYAYVSQGKIVGNKVPQKYHNELQRYIKE